MVDSGVVRLRLSGAANATLVCEFLQVFVCSFGSWLFYYLSPVIDRPKA